MHTPHRSGRSNLRLMLIALPILVVIAAIVNAKTISRIAKGETSFKSVIYGIAEGGEGIFEGIQIPDNIGDPEAKVTVEAFVRRGAGCHAGTVFMAQAMGTIDPERIRIVFQDTSTSAGLQRHSAVKLGCEQGMAINGKVQFKQTPVTGVPTGKPGDKATTVILTGGHEMHWTPDQMYRILDAELKKAYKGKGMKMSLEEFKAKLSAEQKTFQDRAEAEMKAKQEAAKAAR